MTQILWWYYWRWLGNPLTIGSLLSKDDTNLGGCLTFISWLLLTMLLLSVAASTLTVTLNGITIIGIYSRLLQHKNVKSSISFFIVVGAHENSVKDWILKFIHYSWSLTYMLLYLYWLSWCHFVWHWFLFYSISVL